ncbi:hypothetical protein PG996_007864 [Apiospora saccharicola]|uniref:Uncharacterized protein n=1 Tax=Apiospora saccharicola TaxID=335842 RepID=A0ABR1UWB5_9PEZI
MSSNTETSSSPKMTVYRAPPPAPSSVGFSSGSSTPWTFLTGFFRTAEQEWLDGIPKQREGFEDLVWAENDVADPADDDLMEILVDDYWVWVGTRSDLREKKRKQDILLGKCE